MGHCSIDGVYRNDLNCHFGQNHNSSTYVRKSKDLSVFHGLKFMMSKFDLFLIAVYSIDTMGGAFDPASWQTRFGGNCL
jgi:hypothetical protein